MTYPNQADVVEAESASGVATAYIAPLRAGSVQVSVSGVTGSGTLTLTAQPFGSDSYEAIEDGTIDLSAQTTVLIEGRLKNIKGTSSSGSDVFTLVVTQR